MNLLIDLIPLLFPLFQFFKINAQITKRKHQLDVISYASLILWALLAIYYELLEKDIVNTSLLAFMIILIIYLIKYNPRILEREFVIKTVSIALLIYFPLKLFDGFLGVITHVTAYLTFFVSKILVANLEFSSTVISSPVYNYKFTFACTGLQSIALITAPLLALDHKKYLRRAIGIGSLIYILNILRGVGIIYGVEVLSIDYYLLHTLIMKLFSIIAIMVIFYYVLSTTTDLVKELREIINDVKRHPHSEKKKIVP